MPILSTAILATFLSFGPILRVYLAGVNFFTLYGLSVIAYLKLAENRRARLFGLLAMALVVIVMYSFGGLLLYPAALLGAGFAWVYLGGLRIRKMRSITPLE